MTASKENWDDRIVCYYSNWGQYRPDEGKFFPEDLNPSLCTHIIFAYAKVIEVEEGWGIGPVEWKDPDIDLTVETFLNPEQFLTADMDLAERNYAIFHNVTKAHPGLKVSTVSL